MTNLQQYFKKSYDAYLRLKNQMELQDLEVELEYENLANLDETYLDDPGLMDELIRIEKQEKIII